MKRNKNGTSGFAAGIFIGGLLGTVAVMLFAVKNGLNLGSKITKMDGHVGQLQVPGSKARVEEVGNTAQRGRSRRGWRLIFSLASVVAMVADSKMRKT